MKIHTVYLALGSNLGNKSGNLQRATKEIAEKVGTVSAVSSVYETAPWGFQSPNAFANSVIRVKTGLSPTLLLQLTQEIEERMGRTKKSSGNTYQDRIIDIDLILYDDLVINTPELIIPHPHFHKRMFVLEPLCDISPDLKHPVFQKTIRQLLDEINT